MRWESQLPLLLQLQVVTTGGRHTLTDVRGLIIIVTYSDG